MLSKIARGVPRFSITSERLSLSTRFSSLPKFDLARRAGITILSFAAVLVLGINSPVHLFEVYSYTVRSSMAREGRSLPEARASRARRRAAFSVKAAEKIVGGFFSFLRVAFHAARDQVAVRIAAQANLRHDVVEALHCRGGLR